jgi:hypothetical protein
VNFLNYQKNFFFDNERFYFDNLFNISIFYVKKVVRKSNIYSMGIYSRVFLIPFAENFDRKVVYFFLNELSLKKFRDYFLFFSDSEFKINSGLKSKCFILHLPSIKLSLKYKKPKYLFDKLNSLNDLDKIYISNILLVDKKKCIRNFSILLNYMMYMLKYIIDFKKSIIILLNINIVFKSIDGLKKNSNFRFVVENFIFNEWMILIK